MTEKELTAIEVLVNAATPAPWGFGPSAAGENHGWWVSGPPNDLVYRDSQYERKEDAAFVALMRQIAPKLIAEVRRLQKEQG